MGNPLSFLKFLPDAIASQNAFEEEKRAQLDNMMEYGRSASMEKANAVSTRVSGGAAAGRRRMEGSALLGQQKLAYAMGGIDSSSGTAAQTIKSSELFSDLDAITLQNNAIRSAMGHEESARKYNDKADRIKAKYSDGSFMDGPANRAQAGRIFGMFVDSALSSFSGGK